MVTAKKRILSVVICTVMFMTCFAVLGMAQRVHATVLDDMSGIWEMTYYPSKKAYNYYELANTKDVTIDMATVSVNKPEIVSLIKKKWEGDPETYYMFRLKKGGKATITFKAKEPGAGDETYVTKKITVKSIKYVNALKTFKIGSKNYASKFKKEGYYWQQKKVSGKLTIKAKKGWKIKGIWYGNFNKGKEKKIKNGKKITLKKNNYVYVWVKKKGKNINLYYQISR